jgi:hypothetical protein
MSVRLRFDYLLVATGTLLTLIYFHASFLEVHDDGVFAYVAQQLLNGAILNRDVLSFHPGLLHFIHVIAFRLFGVDFVSLRYPLLLSTFLQVMVVYTIFRGRGVIIGLVAALLMLASSMVLYNNPSGNWHSQLCFWCLCLILMKTPPERSSRYFCSGMVLGICFLFRQLTFVFLSFGYLSFLAAESGRQQKSFVKGMPSTGVVLSRSLFFCAGFPVLFYTLNGVNPDGALLFCLMPLFLHFRFAMSAQIELCPLLWRGVLTILGVGASVGPFVLYIANNHDLGLWLENTFVTPFALHEAEYRKIMFFLWLPFFGIREILANQLNPEILLNSTIWSVLPFASLVLGIVIFRSRSSLCREPLPVLALSYGLVAVYYEIPIYLIYTLAPTLTALLFISSYKFERLSIIVAVGLSLVLFYYHAAQPLERGVLGMLRGARPPTEACTLPHCSLQVGHEVNVQYGRLYEILRPLLAGGASFYAFPYNPELFFLLDVPSHTGGYHFVMDVRNRRELEHLIHVFEEDAPQVLVVDLTDKAADRYAHELWSRIGSRYTHIAQVDTVDIFQLRDR